MSNATGSRTILGMGLERTEAGVPSYGIPGSALIGYNVILPTEARLGITENPSGEVNPSAFRRPGVPGPKGGPIANVGIPFNTSNLLELFEHLLGGVVKDEPETGVFTYTFTPDPDGVDTHFSLLVGLLPVELWWNFGVKFGQMVLEIGDNTPIVPRLQGEAQHGTYLGAAVPAAGNTGTYTLGPSIRGLVADPSAGSIWAEIESVAPLQFKVIQAAVEPDGAAWTAADTTFDAYIVDSEGAWQNVQSSEDGLDLGIFDENKDPLQIVWPGGAVEHADLAVGDIFEFPLAGDWSEPALTALSGPRFTSAHWVTRFREIGAGTWDSRTVRTGSITLGRPVSADRGNNSRYPHQILREGDYNITAALTRSLIDTWFRDKMNRHGQLEMELGFEGRQLHAAHREGAVLTYPAAKVTERVANPSAPTTIEEQLTIVGETNDAGDPPVTVVVTTDRDWTPTA